VEHIKANNISIGSLSSQQYLPLPTKESCYRLASDIIADRVSNTKRKIQHSIDSEVEESSVYIGSGEVVSTTTHHQQSPNNDNNNITMLNTASKIPNNNTFLIFDERLYQSQVSRIKHYNNDLHSKHCANEIKLEIARKFQNETFYFPHNLDFRGRAYPVPPNLNHLGDDLCRGLLIFDQKRPLGVSGLKWLKIQLCNLFGHNKISLSERLAWTELHMGDVMDSARDPLGGECCVSISRVALQ